LKLDEARQAEEVIEGFRDQLVAAPLKLVTKAGSRAVTPGAAAVAGFRDQLVAAPLKLVTKAGELVTAVGGFRDQLVAAPLKPCYTPSSRPASSHVSATNWSRPH